MSSLLIKLTRRCKRTTQWKPYRKWIYWFNLYSISSAFHHNADGHHFIHWKGFSRSSRRVVKLKTNTDYKLDTYKMLQDLFMRKKVKSPNRNKKCLTSLRLKLGAFGEQKLNFLFFGVTVLTWGRLQKRGTFSWEFCKIKLAVKDHVWGIRTLLTWHHV